MKCPKCNGELTVLQTRQKTDCVFRRRQCAACGFRLTTKESPVNVKLPTSGTNDDDITEPMHALCRRLGISQNGAIGRLLASTQSARPTD